MARHLHVARRDSSASPWQPGGIPVAVLHLTADLLSPVPRGSRLHRELVGDALVVRSRDEADADAHSPLATLRACAWPLRVYCVRFAAAFPVVERGVPPTSSAPAREDGGTPLPLDAGCRFRSRP